MRKYKINIEGNIYQMIILALIFAAFYELGKFIGEKLLDLIK